MELAWWSWYWQVACFEKDLELIVSIDFEMEYGCQIPDRCPPSSYG